MSRKAFTVLVVVLFFATLSFGAYSAQAQEAFPPRPTTTFVSDGIGALSSQQAEAINASGARLHQVTGATLLFVTVNDCGSDPKQYGKNLFDTWKIGDEKRNDGFLLLFCWANGVKGVGRTVVSVPGRDIEVLWPAELRTQITKMYIAPVLAQDKKATELLGSGELGNSFVRTYEEYVRRMLPTTPQSAPVQSVTVPQPPQVAPTPQDTGSWTLLGIKLPIWVWLGLLLVILLLFLAFLLKWWGESSSGPSGSAQGMGSTFQSTNTNDRFAEGLIIGQSLSRPSSTPSHHTYSPPPTHYDPPSAPSFDSGPSYGGSSSDSGSFGGSSGSASSDNV